MYFIDLHSDLLSYLAKSTYNTAWDPISRSSILQLIEGKVKIQTLAIYHHTGADSVRMGMKQAKIYCDLESRYEGYFAPFKPRAASKSKVQTLYAIENASCFFLENEPLEKGFQRLDRLRQKAGKALYMSLTWNMENRFGGGSWTKVGLKPDGQELLRLLHRYSCAVDTSHASDKLFWDIANFVEKEKLNIQLIASHSNFRHCCDSLRNITSEMAIHIAKKGGLIGLNLVRQFAGKEPEDLLQHIEEASRLGVEKALAIGADFYADAVVSPRYRTIVGEPFFKELGDSSSIGRLYQMIVEHFGRSIADGIAHAHALAFINRVY